MLRKSVFIFCSVAAALAFARLDRTRPVITEQGRRFVAGQLILQLKPELREKISLQSADQLAFFGVPALDELSHRYGVDNITSLFCNPRPSDNALRLGVDLQYVVQFDPGYSVWEVCRAYEATGLVEYAEPNAVLPVLEVPNDSLYNRQWHLERIGAPTAWARAKGDSAVVLLVIDMGVDWLHPDLNANVWINHPEDINGNGKFDTLPPPWGDLDDIDQDGNLYRDDVIGYDFLDRDPVPMPKLVDGHGTFCCGIANAVTNNSEGVAAPPWNVRSMVVRCGRDGGIYLDAAVAAIHYAVPRGVWAISMSFGDTSRYMALEYVCLYAWNEGCVLFGGAGNNAKEQKFYPACYPGVIAVAGSDTLDYKADYSNYGSWIGLCAPGTNILTTVNRSGGYYGAGGGTSAATPLVAGVTCWMKSYEPGLTNTACTSKLFAACAAMPDTLFAQGKLGAGRLSMSNLVQGIEESREKQLPQGVAFQILPNPLSHTCRVDFLTSVTGKVELRVYDPSGRFIRSCTQVVKEAEGVGFSLNTLSLETGVYLLQLVTPRGMLVQKAVLRR